MIGRLGRILRRHRDHEPAQPAKPSFSIVTPVRNGATFLDQTILSVVTQAGPFSIRYHVQDGGSSDGTLDLLARWSKRLAGDFPILCAGVEFSYSSEPDAGLYDALNKGFDRCGPQDFMSWINADDLYQPGAFVSVTKGFLKFADVQWIGSNPYLMSEAGEPGLLSESRRFPQEAIRAGIFDGRFAPYFLQQEGMFWRRELWNRIGGLNSRMQLAGDFDLWRRFAQHADLVMSNTLLGCFRVRSGQLSGDIGRYHREIDDGLTAEEKITRGEVAERYRTATMPEEFRAAGFHSRFFENHVFAEGWYLATWP